MLGGEGQEGRVPYCLRRIVERSGDVLMGESWIGREEILKGIPIGEAAHEYTHGDTRAFDTGLPMMYSRINTDPIHPGLTFHGLSSGM
jgi:hypothetical protein